MRFVVLLRFSLFFLRDKAYHVVTVISIALIDVRKSFIRDSIRKCSALPSIRRAFSTYEIFTSEALMHSNHVIPAFFKYSTTITIQVSVVDGFKRKIRLFFATCTDSISPEMVYFEKSAGVCASTCFLAFPIFIIPLSAPEVNDFPPIFHGNRIYIKPS